MAASYLPIHKIPSESKGRSGFVSIKIDSESPSDTVKVQAEVSFQLAIPHRDDAP